MANSVDMNFTLHLYEIAKRDLYTLLIKGSKDKLDYIGDVTFFGPIVDLEYCRANRSGLDFDGRLQVCNTVDKLLKSDVDMWGITNRINKLYSFSPNTIHTNKYDLSLSLKKEEVSEPNK